MLQIAQLVIIVHQTSHVQQRLEGTLVILGLYPKILWFLIGSMSRNCLVD